MGLVTFGVPVYNGETLIAECLDCICGQTLHDLEIVVSDNASTDATSDIVRAYAARDSRIRHIRQSENVGLMGNFQAVLAAATSPYFTFRCHDDVSSANYAENLLASLRKRDAELAAPTVETFRAGRLIRTIRPPVIHNSATLAEIRTLLFRSHQAWFCGLWRTDTLRDVLPKVWAAYDSPWGPDHLSLYPVLITSRVTFAPGASYVQRITPKAGAAAYRKPRLREMMRLRKIFLAVCREFRHQRNVVGVRGWIIAIMTWFYTGKRVFRARNILTYTLLGRW